MAQKQLLGRMLLSFVIGATLLLTLVVDWTVGHMHDSSWPPHARFYLLMYHGTVLITSIVAMYWLLGPSRYLPTPTVDRGIGVKNETKRDTHYRQ
jgi:hypothetical protein